MKPEAATARRALIRAYRAYLEAEAALDDALDEAAALVPELRQHHLRPIGAPGSRVRRLQESRNHSVERLEVVRNKHHRAVLRLTTRHHVSNAPEEIAVLPR